MLVIGLTGLIGSGKTTIADLFAKKGVHIVDTDLIAHQLTSHRGKALPFIRKFFGEGVFNPDGSLNRAMLRKIVFSDTDKRLELESILHPMIKTEAISELNRNKHALYSIIVVPLLFKSKNYLELTKRNIFVDCEYKELVKRLRERSGLTQSEVDQILASQVMREKQIELADDVIENNGNIEELLFKVAQLHEKYMLLR